MRRRGEKTERRGTWNSGRNKVSVEKRMGIEEMGIEEMRIEEGEHRR